MSATTAELLEQIMGLELLIKDQRSHGRETNQLENQLLELKEKFETMNDALSGNRSLLKG